MLLILFGIASLVAALYYKFVVDSGPNEGTTQVEGAKPAFEPTVTGADQKVEAIEAPVVCMKSSTTVASMKPSTTVREATVPEAIPVVAEPNIAADIKTSQTPTALNATVSELNVAQDIQERVEGDSRQAQVLPVGVPEVAAAAAVVAQELKGEGPDANANQAASDAEIKHESKEGAPADIKKKRSHKHKHKRSNRTSTKKSSKRSSKKSVGSKVEKTNAEQEKVDKANAEKVEPEKAENEKVENANVVPVGEN